MMGLTHNKDGANGAPVGSGDVISIDQNTAEGSFEARMNNRGFALAFDGSSEDLFAVQPMGGGQHQLVRLDRINQSVAQVMGTLVDSQGVYHNVAAMGFWGGKLYGVSSVWEPVGGFWVPMGYLVEVNPANGSCTPIGPLGITPYSRGGKVVDGKFYLLTATEKVTRSVELYSIDLSTGAATLVGDTGLDGRAVALSVDRSGELFAAISGSPSGGGPDLARSHLYSLSPGNAGTVYIGDTGFDYVSGLAWQACNDCVSIIAGKNMWTNDDAYVDAWDSREGPYSAGLARDVSMAGNGDIVMEGNSYIRGNVYWGDSISVGSSVTVTGVVEQLVDDVPFPTVDVSAAQASNNNGSLGLTDLGNDPFEGSGTRYDFNLNGSDSITIPPGVYYFGSMIVQNQATLTVTGNVTIFVDGNVNVVDGATVDTGGSPGRLDIRATGNKVDIDSSSELEASIIAPNAMMKVKGTGQVYGILIAEKLNIHGDASYHVDLSLSQ